MERTEILARLRERIVVFAASRIGRDAAEDIAQETLILLHEKYAHVSRLEELVPLSLQIARFKLMSVTRKAHRRGEDHAVPVDEIQVPDLNADPSLTVERRELLERLERALPQLGERCRELFRLKLQGRSFPEIQKLMQAASVNTVYTWDFRCRKQLLELLGGSWEAKR